MGETDGGIETLFGDANRQQAIMGWGNSNQNQGYKTWGPHRIVFHNSVTATLSTDNARIYLVDDLPMPPHPVNFQNFRFGGGQPQFGALQDQAYRNSLKCCRTWNPAS